MPQTPALTSATQFLDLIWDTASPTDADISAALDRLMVAYHDTPMPLGRSAPTQGPPTEDWQTVYDAAAKRFPDYGMYPISDPLSGDPTMGMMGDAIDDIADISKEMRQVVWYHAHQGTEAAQRQFKTFYVHWGTHARELSLYLHARQFG